MEKDPFNAALDALRSAFPLIKNHEWIGEIIGDGEIMQMTAVCLREGEVVLSYSATGKREEWEKDYKDVLEQFSTRLCEKLEREGLYP